MGIIAVKFSIAPESPETDLNALKEGVMKLKEEIEKEFDMKFESQGVEIRDVPIGFGITKLLVAFFVNDKTLGDKQISAELEKRLGTIGGVGEVMDEGADLLLG